MDEFLKLIKLIPLNLDTPTEQDINYDTSIIPFRWNFTDMPKLKLTQKYIENLGKSTCTSYKQSTCGAKVFVEYVDWIIVFHYLL